MGERHDRYDELAVGHVLGGLEAADAARFRSHLVGCRACRARVAELRSIAADLVAAERDERAHEVVRTEVERHDEPLPAVDPPPSRITVRHVTVAVVIVAILGTAMAFWNLHLRALAAGYREAAVVRADTLRELATGVPVAVDVAEGVSALVVVDGEDVAFALAGLPELTVGDVLVVWLVDAEQVPTPVLRQPAAYVDGSSVSGVTADQGARELLISIERGEPGEAPRGVELVRAELRRTVPEPG